MQTGMWIVVTLLLYLCIGAAISLHVWNMEEAKTLNFVLGKYFSVHKLGYTVQVERGLWSISSFGVWFRLLRYDCTIDETYSTFAASVSFCGLILEGVSFHLPFLHGHW
jgi:hypothetical protein